MLDVVVTLRPAEDIARFAIAGSPSDTTYDPDTNVVRIRMELYAPRPDRECVMKLWNRLGRKPELKVPEKVDSQPDVEKVNWRLASSIDELDGRTATWSARMASRRTDNFELRVTVFQGNTPLPEGRFFYAGPLEAGEIEERTGRFHFKVERRTNRESE